MSGTSSATLASAPSLNVSAGLATDLLVLLRAQPANGQPTVYEPQNITAAAWLASLLPAAITAMIEALPTTDGTTSPLWNDAGALTVTTGTTAGSGQPLTVAAAMATLKAAFATMGTTDPKDGKTPWLDDNVVAVATAPGS